MEQVLVKRCWRLCCLVLVLAAGLLAGGARAQTVATCPVGPDASWSKTEAWVWAQVCVGNIADLTSLDPAPLSLTSAAPWPADRVISAGFLQEMLTDPRYRMKVSVGPIAIVGARVTDPLVIGNAVWKNKLYVQDSRFDASLEIYDSDASQGLVLIGDRFGGPLIISRSKVEYLTLRSTSGSDVKITNTVFTDDVLFDTVQFPGSFSIVSSHIGGELGLVPVSGTANGFGQVIILDTKVDGPASISNSVFSGEFDGALSSFGGGFSISDSTFAELAFFRATDFVKPADISETSFAHDLRFDTANFESELTLQNLDLCLGGKPCELFLADANFGGKVVFDQILINGDINTDGASASRSVELWNDGNARYPIKVTMIDASFSRNLSFGNTKLSYLQLANASIAGTLEFLEPPGAGWVGTASPTGWAGGTAWTSHAFMGLSGTDIGVLTNYLWDWPPQINAEGMSFGLIGLQRPDLDKAGCIDGLWSHWLQAGVYSPQPYRQLAKYQADSGDPEAAACTLETSQTIALSKKGLLARVVYWTYGEVAGFGYAPERAFWFAAGFVLIGMLVLWVTGEGRKNNMPVGLFYSFSEFIPLVSLDKRFDDVELRGVARWYFYVHKIVGYIIALFIAAALSGLTSKS